MGCLKRIFGTLGVLVAVMPAPNASRAQPQSDQTQLRIFATCAGRLSAEMEYQWMFDGLAADAIKAERASMLEILEAMMVPERARTVLNWRIEAKMAQAALLTRATFGSDAREQRHARVLAQRHMETCRAQLLS